MGEYDAAGALLRVTIFALDNDDFRSRWEQAVRDGADAVTAQVAGAMMAGREEGDVNWDCTLPYPVCMSEDEVNLAYRHAVRNEASRRLEHMASKPTGGLG